MLPGEVNDARPDEKPPRGVGMLDGADEALLRFLSKHGQLEPSGGQAAEEYARAHRVSMLEALCDGGFVDEESLADLFHVALRLPRVTVRAVKLPKPLAEEILRLHLATPVEVAS